MVQKIGTKINEHPPFELTLNCGDTIILQFDQDEWDIEMAKQLSEIWQKTFPKNNLITTFKGMEVKGVIHGKYL